MSILLQWAGPIRLLLAYLEIDYEEILYQLPVQALYKHEQNHQCSSIKNKMLRVWKEEKNSLGLPFPNVNKIITLKYTLIKMNSLDTYF